MTIYICEYAYYRSVTFRVLHDLQVNRKTNGYIESVADQTKRPLYTISSGDLGVQPTTVEKKLKAALDLATMWNAIVLTDEADIFLEQRSMHDLDRNSLVSSKNPRKQHH